MPITAFNFFYSHPCTFSLLANITLFSISLGLFLFCLFVYLFFVDSTFKWDHTVFVSGLFHCCFQIARCISQFQDLYQSSGLEEWRKEWNTLSPQEVAILLSQKERSQQGSPSVSVTKTVAGAPQCWKSIGHNVNQALRFRSFSSTLGKLKVTWQICFPLVVEI